MPGGVLGQAVQEDIDVVAAVVVKAGKGVVHHGQSSCRARVQGQMLDVRDLGDGIRGTLEDHQTRRLLFEQRSMPGRSSIDSMVCVTPNLASICCTM